MIGYLFLIVLTLRTYRFIPFLQPALLVSMHKAKRDAEILRIVMELL